MKDGAFSDTREENLTNLYNNADIDDNVRDVMVEQLYRFTYRHGFSLDGSVWMYLRQESMFRTKFRWWMDW